MRTASSKLISFALFTNIVITFNSLFAMTLSKKVILDDVSPIYEKRFINAGNQYWFTSKNDKLIFLYDFMLETTKTIPLEKNFFFSRATVDQKISENSQYLAYKPLSGNNYIIKDISTDKKIFDQKIFKDQWTTILDTDFSTSNKFLYLLTSEGIIIISIKDSKIIKNFPSESNINTAHFLTHNNQDVFVSSDRNNPNKILLTNLEKNTTTTILLSPENKVMSLFSSEKNYLFVSYLNQNNQKYDYAFFDLNNPSKKMILSEAKNAEGSTVNTFFNENMSGGDRRLVTITANSNFALIKPSYSSNKFALVNLNDFSVKTGRNPLFENNDLYCADTSPEGNYLYVGRSKMSVFNLRSPNLAEIENFTMGNDGGNPSDFSSRNNNCQAIHAFSGGINLITDTLYGYRYTYQQWKH